ncbi:MAG: sigma-70 family RNA polymerase sigma factor [Planctomycetes bacterium]|nr:sigma-70 family RNA polymerase sigma factor [Planctomycetota bacterium]
MIPARNAFDKNGGPPQSREARTDGSDRLSDWIHAVFQGVCSEDPRRPHPRSLELTWNSSGLHIFVYWGGSAFRTRDAAERSERIRHVIEELPAGIRDAVILRLTHGLSYRAISKRLGIGCDDVGTRLYRGLRYLHEKSRALME